MCDGELIAVEHLPEELRCGAASPAGPTAEAGAGDAAADTATWRNLEQSTLRTLLDRHRGTRRALAAQLGISERTLYRKIRQMAP